MNLLKLAVGVTYATVTILFLRRHRDRVKDSYSSLEKVNLQWLLWLAASGAAIWMLAVVFLLMERVYRPILERGDDIITLAIAILVYGIGYMALRQPEIFRFEAAEPGVPEPGAAAPRYERSGLGDREASALKERLLALMETERPWQDSGLTLADLAGRLATTPHKLSEVLNSQLGQTYYDFVNAYRIREVQRRMASREAANLTLLALALDAGFASKSTFNLVFKKHTGQTPSDYRRAAGD
jgi:AraC-like DNA-binding protein